MTPAERDAARAIVKALRGNGTDDMNAMLNQFGKVSLADALKASVDPTKKPKTRVRYRAAQLLEAMIDANTAG